MLSDFCNGRRNITHTHQWDVHRKKCFSFRAEVWIERSCLEILFLLRRVVIPPLVSSLHFSLSFPLAAWVASFCLPFLHLILDYKLRTGQQAKKQAALRSSLFCSRSSIFHWAVHGAIGIQRGEGRALALPLTHHTRLVGNYCPFNKQSFKSSLLNKHMLRKKLILVFHLTQLHTHIHLDPKKSQMLSRSQEW